MFSNKILYTFSLQRTRTRMGTIIFHPSYQRERPLKVINIFYVFFSSRKYWKFKRAVTSRISHQ